MSSELTDEDREELDNWLISEICRIAQDTGRTFEDAAISFLGWNLPTT